jgi:pentatricopeptide repeat protein
MTSPETRIGDYALLGDTRTAALTSSEGSIDWMCLPRFDSEPIFGRLVAGELGGSFSIRPVDLQGVSRQYVEESAVLETSWKTGSGRAFLTEGMVLDVTNGLLPQMILVRELRCTDGNVEVRAFFNPLKGLPGRRPKTDRRNNSLICTWGSFVLVLRTSSPVSITPGTEQSIDLQSGEELTFVMTMADRTPIIFVDPGEARRLLEESARWWKEWLNNCEYSGPHRETVVRSLITLRLLTYSPSGAPVAAPTTSLPEVIGGGSNWDYRYSWPRDAAIGIDAFLSVGMHEEPAGFIRWLLHADRLTRPEIRVVYDVFGKPAPNEIELGDLPGYRGSRPVRVGNAAKDQFQLDVYGWVLDAAWRFEQAGHRLFAETWRSMSSSADFISDNWQRPDNGIWEVRGRGEQFVQSKLMCWLALERALDLARSHKTSERRLRKWRHSRDSIADAVSTQGTDERGVFKRTFGSNELDASALVPLIDLMEFRTIDLQATVDALRNALGIDGALLYRYRPDIKKGGDGAFLACSFWLIQALAVLGHVDEAAELFDEMCSRSNDLNLFGEEMDPATGEHLGNFPQALTHGSLIRAAVALEASQPGRRKDPRITP